MTVTVRFKDIELKFWWDGKRANHNLYSEGYKAQMIFADNTMGVKTQ